MTQFLAVSILSTVGLTLALNVAANPFKASRLGKFAGREAIEGRFGRAKEKIDPAPTKRTVAEVLAGATGKDDFVAKLKARNVDVVFRYIDDGRIYGATFIDRNTMSVLNGSRLGKEFSANALNERFNNPQMQLDLAMRADTISQRRYDTNVETFLIGKISTLDLNDSQVKKDQARRDMVNELYLYWSYYFQLRSLTLWDYSRNRDIDADIERLVK